ncbi:MAG TPA: TPM domain-containing protein [Caulobacteraceae bacterium]|nr:TPM domain-containing protein [Caulobacteraceae bacterium]
MLSKTDHDAIAQAVGRAEARTSGEILCVLAHKVSNYRETPLAWAAIAALVLPPVAVASGLRAPIGGSAWDSALVGTEGAVRMALGGYALAQMAIFVVVAVLIAAVGPLKLALTPGVLKHRRVRQAALAQLRAARLLGADVGAAVVVFASLEDRIVAVVGDEAIHAKVGDEAWAKAVTAVQDGVRRGAPASGFIAAVELCGAVLAEHFPASGAPHHLADGVMEV